MPRTRSLAWAQLKIGVLAVLALGLTAFFIWAVGGQGGFFWQQYHLKARFPDVQGLQTGAAVRVAGVTVGTVDSMEFVGSQVEVVLRVSKTMQPRITNESRAFIGSLSLLGAAVVDVTPATAGQPIPDWGYLTSRRPYGQLADVADAASKGLDEATRLLHDLREGRGTVGKLFTDDALYREIAKFVDAAEEVVATLNRGEGTLGRLLKDPAVERSLQASLENVAAITKRINEGQGTLGRLSTDDTFAKSLEATTSNLEAISGKIGKGEGTAGKLVNDPALFNRLNSLSERLDGMMARLEKGEGTAGQLLHDKQLYENMNATVNEVRALVADIRKDPKKYLNVKVSIF